MAQAKSPRLSLRIEDPLSVLLSNSNRHVGIASFLIRGEDEVALKMGFTGSCSRRVARQSLSLSRMDVVLLPHCICLANLRDYIKSP